MKNVAYTSEYEAYRAKSDYIFCVKYLKGKTTKEISKDLSIIIYSYEESGPKHPILNCPYAIHCSHAQLIDKKGQVLYSIKNVHDDTRFFDLIEHQNGKRYLVFRIDLYGYSILDLDTMKDYHYIPEESLNGGEAFIWTGTYYNKDTNLLAVEGCYWACPYEVYVVDFSEPANLPYPEIRLNEFLNCDGDDHMDFESWNDDHSLVVRFAERDTREVIKADSLINQLRHSSQ